MQRQRPIILGIIGDSATGKTTISQGLVKILGEERVTHLCTDDYHKYDRQERAELGISALHPDCNYLDILELHMERMHYGQPILKPVYDHSTGTLVRPEYIHPLEFVIVDGLLGYATPAMQQFYDIKVYLDPLEELRRIWKIKRDTTKRGYTPDQVRASIQKREYDSSNFIRPQREAADIVIRFYPPNKVAPQDAGSHLNVQLILRPTIPHPDLSYLFERNGMHAVRLEMSRAYNRPVDVLEIDGNVTLEQATELENAIWQHVPNLRPLPEKEFGDYQDQTEVRHSSPLALTQLLLVYHLLLQYHNVARMPFAPPVAALSRLGAVSAARPEAAS